MTPAFSIIRTAPRTGTTGRRNIPAGTVNAWRGPSSTVSACSSSMWNRPCMTPSRTHTSPTWIRVW